MLYGHGVPHPKPQQGVIQKQHHHILWYDLIMRRDARPCDYKGNCVF